jgi:SAM-dependent methyltransferase
MARYDEIGDFYVDRVGMEAGDPSAAAVLGMMGDVRGTRALDLACGPGRIARELARRGATVVGADVSEVLLGMALAAEASEPLGIAYRLEDVTSTAALDGQRFDAVACNHALADIDDLDGAVATVARVLRTGGRFVFSILHPCFPGWDETAPSSWPRAGGYRAEGWWLADNPGFRGKVGSNHRMLSTYVNTLARHGLAIEELAEPESTPDVLARQALAQPGAGSLPMFLAARCARLPARG